MKILHTGDWHIGKVINEFSLLPDQKYIIAKLFEVITLEQPDVIIISGDIYDRSIPPKEAVELLDATLTRIIEEFSIPTLIVSGNHDSQERLSFGNKVLEHKKLFIEGVITNDIKKVTLEDEYGNVNFYLLPYAHPALIRNLLNDDSIHDHNDAFNALMKQIKVEFDSSERNVLINHNYIIYNNEKNELSESERSLSIGGADFVDVAFVEDFDYVALGHLHRPQRVKKDNIRYSGSLLKYHFSEHDSDKGVVLVDLKQKGVFSHHFVKLGPLKDMRMIEGKLNELIKPSFYKNINCEDYILAKLTDEDDLYDPLSSLRAIYPNIMQIQRNNQIMNIESGTKANGDFKQKSKSILFEEFYKNIMSQELSENKKELLESIIAEVERDEVKS